MQPFARFSSLIQVSLSVRLALAASRVVGLRPSIHRRKSHHGGSNSSSLLFQGPRSALLGSDLSSLANLPLPSPKMANPLMCFFRGNRSLPACFASTPTLGATNGAMDAGNLLKPMLGRGELRRIGATTLDEYCKYIKKDPALERRFQHVYVDQPTVEDTISILCGLHERYELHHGVRISDSALVGTAVLSDRYISGKFLFDKAIDLVDEYAAKLKMEITFKPIALDEIDQSVLKMEMEHCH